MWNSRQPPSSRLTDDLRRDGRVFCATTATAFASRPPMEVVVAGLATGSNIFTGQGFDAVDYALLSALSGR